jgi:secretion/DNA translocation related TadE-like protein
VCPDAPERGSATVWAAGLLALIGLVIVVGVAQATAVIARHRVETAADLAALAGAAAVSARESDGCAAAATFAERNGARLGACVLLGEDVEVTVSRPVRFWRLGVRSATARARAGPVDRSVSGSEGAVAAKSAATAPGG